MTKQSRSILTIAGSVIALVIASVVAVLVFAPAANHFAPGSPEDVFQRYLTSYEQRGIHDRVRFLLDPCSEATLA